MQEFERRQALADFLREKRAQLSPTEVGLSPGGRRRAVGLRREDVAQLANIGFSWYVSLEQGRDIHPSISVLESLAQALKLTSNERRHLFLLAGQSLPPHVWEEQVNPVLQHMLDEVYPLPAYVLGYRWDYLAWNRAAELVFAIAPSASPYPYNMLWRIFAHPNHQERSPDWEEVARGALAEFRASSARYPGDVRFEELIEDLKRVSPEFRQWWPHHEVRRVRDGQKVVEHATLGHLEFEHLTLQVPSDPDVILVMYLPTSETREKLHRFLADKETSSGFRESR